MPLGVLFIHHHHCKMQLGRRCFNRKLPRVGYVFRALDLNNIYKALWLWLTDFYRSPEGRPSRVNWVMTNKALTQDLSWTGWRILLYCYRFSLCHISRTTQTASTIIMKKKCIRRVLTTMLGGCCGLLCFELTVYPANVWGSVLFLFEKIRLIIACYRCNYPWPIWLGPQNLYFLIGYLA